MIKLPNTVMFKNITVSDIQNRYVFKKQCCICNELATKRIIRTNIMTENTQIKFYCDYCLEKEIIGINKYMRKEAD